jgi:hypothetical protein
MVIILLAGCHSSKLPDNDYKLNDIDLKKQSIQMDGLTMRLPSGLKCIKDSKEYPDFEIYRFIATNSRETIVNLYLGNHPNISSENVKLTNASIGKLKFKCYIGPTDTNTLTLLIETGFTFPAFMHFWLDIKDIQIALEIIRTIRRNK